MLALLALHLLLALAAPAAAPRVGRGVFLLAAAAPLATSVWAATRLDDVLAGRRVAESVPWVPGLGLTVDLRLDPLSLLLVTLVSGVGTLVFLYCARYFSPDAAGLGRFAAVLTGFAGAMLGLVLADDLLLLYVFWELTSVTSFLLIGFHDEQGESRRAAVQALLVTTLGGLVMLLGFVLLGQAAGTYSVTGLLADPPRGGAVAVALVCVLVGAFTKSAQVPLHPWLPSAMAAPTPVSAYLHAAAMVKAGVYLVALLAPAFAEVAPWRPLVLAVGLATMVVGGWRALRQTDLKRLLAFGTVSQLGFLVVLLGAGTREAALAGAAVLLAHGLFKSALFLSVGVLEHETGTRDLRELSGVGRRLPVLATAAVLAAASMAAVPPLFGFIAKEAAYEAFLHGGTTDTLVLVGLFVGSVLTGAYSARFVWGAFATKPGHPATRVHRPAPTFVAPVAVLGVASLLLGLVPDVADPLVQAYAAAYAVEPEPEHLALWHGVTPALLLSGATLGGAAALFLLRDRVRRAQNVLSRITGRLEADAAYDATVRGVERAAVRSTAVVQTGSLPVYLGTVLLTLVLLPGTAAWTTTRIGADLRAWDNPLQAVVAVVIVVSAVVTARAHRRFTAVLYLGGVGYGVAVLFVLHGGPDLALTQFLVETLSLVLFVFVLRRLPTTFQAHRLRLGQGARVLVALGVGAFVTTALLVSAQSRTAEPVSQAFLDRSYEEAGGRNVVNVVLVDFRGFDTLGEITVLVVAALGVASLVLAGRRRRTSPRDPDTRFGTEVDQTGDAAPVQRPEVVA
ncbi:MAG: Na+/H+ antiporter subunit A [Actinomycetota bacterium]|nr:Na+/H+ antiporter subunit A [Actinomycetota bacterium]